MNQGFQEFLFIYLFIKSIFIVCDLINLWKASARDAGSDAADKAVDAVKQGANAAKRTGQEVKDKAASAAEDVNTCV